MIYYLPMDDFFLFRAKLRAWKLLLASDIAEAIPLVRNEIASLKTPAELPRDIADEIDRLRVLVAPTSIVSWIN